MRGKWPGGEDLTPFLWQLTPFLWPIDSVFVAFAPVLTPFLWHLAAL
jgi:hypothetical protein